MTIALILHLDTPVWAVVEQVLIWGSVALTIVSLVDYIYKNRHVLKDGHYEV